MNRENEQSNNTLSKWPSPKVDEKRGSKTGSKATSNTHPPPTGKNDPPTNEQSNYTLMKKGIQERIQIGFQNKQNQAGFQNKQNQAK